MKLLLNIIGAASIAGGSVASLSYINTNSQTQPTVVTVIKKAAANPTHPPITLYYHDNNAKYFLGGTTKEYYYDYIDGSGDTYASANLNFTLTSAGSLGLLQNYLQHPSWHCGVSIVDYFNKTLKHFDNLLSSSYLNRIEHNGWYYKLPGNYLVSKDKEAYSDFIDNMKQPASVVYELSALHDEGETLPSVAVRFHYGYHGFSSDDFDVSFHVQYEK